MPSFLVDNGLLEWKHLLRGSFEIIDASRRNRNFMVKVEGGPSLLVKEGVGEERMRSVHREGIFYQLAKETDLLTGLRPHLPQFLGYFSGECILVLELIDAPDLRQHYSRIRRIPQNWSRRLGRFLGLLHRSTRNPQIAKLVDDDQSQRAPFALWFDEPDLNLLHLCSQASINLVGILQQSEGLTGRLAALRQDWQRECLVHGDFRWNNCLAQTEVDRRKPILKVLDWELATFGDPCWDVATVLAEFLGSWLRSTPLSGDQHTDPFLEFSGFPLEKMHPAINAFWSTYVEAMDLDQQQQAEHLLRSLQYTGARLVQTAFEWLQVTATVTSHSILMLQLADNVLLQPNSAAAGLLGIRQRPEMVA